MSWGILVKHEVSCWDVFPDQKLVQFQVHHQQHQLSPFYFIYAHKSFARCPIPYSFRRIHSLTADAQRISVVEPVKGRMYFKCVSQFSKNWHRTFASKHLTMCSLHDDRFLKDPRHTMQWVLGMLWHWLWGRLQFQWRRWSQAPMCFAEAYVYSGSTISRLVPTDVAVKRRTILIVIFCTTSCYQLLRKHG